MNKRSILGALGLYSSLCSAFHGAHIMLPGAKKSKKILFESYMFPAVQKWSQNQVVPNVRRRLQLFERTSIGESLPPDKNPDKKSSSLLDVILLESDNNEKASIWKSRWILFKMIRPTSIPAIFLFHLLGSFLVAPTIRDWKRFLLHPSSWLTLVMINLVSASSMVVNDYYDAKLGRDRNKDDTSNKYILRNEVGLSTVRVFLMQLYGLSLYISSFLPGTLTRLSATTALVMTYLYTKHLKPRMVLKNVVCAGLIAFAPVTSGLAARAIFDNEVALGFPSDLWRLTLALFSAVMSREIYMDCNDVKADRLGGIRTIPVVKGKPFAVKAAQLGNIVMSIVITASPAFRFFHNRNTWRPLLFAGFASLWQVTRGFQIIRSKGEDQELIHRTVDQSLLVVVLLLASFCG